MSVFEKSEKRGASKADLHLGIDIGSKTVKIVVQNDGGEILYSSYDRHLSDVRRTLEYVLGHAMLRYPSELMTVGVTGSAGMRFSELTGVPFTQEVVACRIALARLVPDADVAIEIGGEDSKILYLTDGEEMRMNSTCAGGTGGFIDTIAGMLDVNAEKLNHYAHGCRSVRPIASRCAVFAQMDVRPLLNEGVSKEDIAGSAFDAVAKQCITGLACGRPISGKVAMLGGPLHFLSALRARFIERLDLSEKDVLLPSEGHLFVAQGAAFDGERGEPRAIASLIDDLARQPWEERGELERLQTLFSCEEEYAAFKNRHASCAAPRLSISRYEGRAYLGVDSGSEAIKYVLVSEDGQVLSTYYKRSAGDLSEAAREMLVHLYKSIPRDHKKRPLVTIAHATVTGYGEHYLKQAFSFDSGEVETVAHIRAARELVPDADFIVDIGGQDIKCIALSDGSLKDIVLNEACSSGCGALLSGMAWSMNVKLDAFVDSALFAENPVDLGTRCTVFMTSRVRHAQKEGVSVGDISAGLAYSVVKNALFKVARVHDASALGKSIVVQGGTFANDAVLRAFEITCEAEVHRPKEAPYMGAYGAALIARSRAGEGSASSLIPRKRVEKLRLLQEARLCGRCANACKLQVTRFFDDENVREFAIGNRCDRWAGSPAKAEGSENMVGFRNSLLLARPRLKNPKRGKVGMLRVLDAYETYPFWHAFFTALGFDLVLSRAGQDSRAASTIPSESVCLPAKLAHSHFFDLLNRGVDVVFAPCLQGIERPRSACPVVAGYPLVLQANVPQVHDGEMRVLSPVLPSLFADNALHPELAALLVESLRSEYPDIDEAEVGRALDEGLFAYREFKGRLAQEGRRVFESACRGGNPVAVLACHPYHLDPDVHHGIPELLVDFGYTVLTADAVSWWDGELSREDGRVSEVSGAANGYRTLRQKQAARNEEANPWERADEVLRAACFAAEKENVDFVGIYSFGCGIDPVMMDKASDLLKSSKGRYSLLKVDEMEDLAAAKIRLRSMMALREGVLKREGYEADQ